MKQIDIKKFIFPVQCILLFILCQFFVPLRDDTIFGYHPFFDYDGFSDLLYSVIYYGNGRILGNLAAIVFAKMPQVFYFVEAILIILFGVILERLFETKYIKELTLCSVIFLPLPIFNQTISWMSSFLNYFLQIFFLALTLLVLKMTVKTESNKILLGGLLFLLGIISQLFVEHGAVINTIISLILIIYFYYRNKANLKWGIVIFIGNIIGLLIILFFTKFLDADLFFTTNFASENYRVSILSCTGFKEYAYYLIYALMVVTQSFSLFILPYTIIYVLLIFIIKKHPVNSHKKITILAKIMMSTFYISFILQLLFSKINNISALVMLFAFISLAGMIIIIFTHLTGAIRIKLIIYISLGIISYAPFLVFSPKTYRVCLLFYFLLLMAAFELYKYLYSDIREYSGKTLTIINTICIFVACVYITLHAHQKRINHYVFQEIANSKEEYILPEMSNTILYNPNDYLVHLPAGCEKAQIKYIPFEEWLELKNGKY